MTFSISFFFVHMDQILKLWRPEFSGENWWIPIHLTHINLIYLTL